jgi:hypothetical protein
MRLGRHPGELPTRCWTIACLRVAGSSAAEIAKIVGRQSDYVRHVCMRLQLPNCGYDLGSPVTIARVANLFRATGLDRKFFASHFGIPMRLAAELYPGAGKRRLKPDHAAPVIDARDRLIRQIYDRNRNAGDRVWSVPSAAGALRALVPDLPQVSATLRELLAQSRAYLRKNPGAKCKEWQDWFCENDRLQLLPLAVDLWPFIEHKIQALRMRRDLRKLWIEILTSRFGVSSSVVHHSGAARSPRPGEIERFILRFQSPGQGVPHESTAAAPEKSSRKHGPDPTPFKKTTRYLIGTAVETEIARTGDRSRKGIMAARYAVAKKYLTLSYDTIKQYHNDTVDWLKENPS